MPTPVHTPACVFCGNRLAIGAIACFRCGKMVERAAGGDTTGGGALPTQLGTRAKGELLEGQWRLVKPLGQGLAGVVWHAQDVGLDRPVAIKLLHDALVKDAVALARFEREARVLATLEHSHIVPVLGVGRHQGQPFLVMKLLEGRSLAEALHARGGRLAVPEAVRIVSQLCEALDFVHGRGVLHRDLKPSNVFVGEDAGQAWLLDLGLAFEAGSDLTRTGEVLGAAPYLSPEQLQGRRVDRRGDVFALGCVTFEALTGRPPFEGELAEVIGHQLHTTPPDANALRPDLPEGVGAVLLRAMAKLPLERQSTAGDFAHELQRACGVAADGTASRLPVQGLVLPSRPVPQPRSSPRRPDSREAQTAPSDPLAPPVEAPREAQTAPSDPLVAVVDEPTRIAQAPTRRPLDEETTVQGAALREGPTGPSKKQRREALKKAGLAFGIPAVALLVALGVFLRSEPPAPAPPTPLPYIPLEKTVIIQPQVDVAHEPSPLLIGEDPKPPPIVTVSPGQETLSMNPFVRDQRRKAAAHAVAVANGGEPTLEVHVYSPMSAGRRPLKADVLFDQEPKGRAPLTFTASIGPHVLQVVTPEYPMQLMELFLSPGDKQKVEIEMLPALPSTAPPPKAASRASEPRKR